METKAAPTRTLSDIAREVEPLLVQGKVADYIPALSEVDPRQFAIVVANPDGSTDAAGAADQLFSIQSVSKLFTLALALSEGLGSQLWVRVGKEPSGDPFNSIVLLERENGIPRNPFINPGALVVADLLCEAYEGVDPLTKVLDLVSELSDSRVTIDHVVAQSERHTGYKNKALAAFLKSYGNLTCDVDRVLDVYFGQCSITMTPRQLALAARFLVTDGVNPFNGRPVVCDSDARVVNAVMLMAGTYDAAGAFAVEVGIPCKSGVGGGIVGTLADGRTVCVWAPGLDETGNSLAGRVALAKFCSKFDLSIFR